ncbi:MAG TPA: hypothetical protein VF800_23780 [Telluria sp.]|jgi:hypothetical protein
MKIGIPTSTNKVFLIGMLFAVPLLLTTGFYFLSPHQKVPGPMELGLVSGLLIASGLLAVATCACMLARRSVELTGDEIVLKHSFYTLRLRREAMQAPVISCTDDIRSLGIAIKTNGIAAFGYYSGWFNATDGQPIFLAISGAPIVVLRFAGHPTCSVLALSASDALQAKLAAWLVQGSAPSGRPG